MALLRTNTSGIVVWGPVKFNVKVFPILEEWDGWSWVHMVGVYWLTVLAYAMPATRIEVLYSLVPYAPLYSMMLGFLWEVGDAFKPLWYQWSDMRPAWIPVKIWRLGGHIFNSDGFGFHDLLIADGSGALVAWGIIVLCGEPELVFGLSFMSLLGVLALFIVYVNKR